MILLNGSRSAPPLGVFLLQKHEAPGKGRRFNFSCREKGGYQGDPEEFIKTSGADPG